MFYTLLSMSPWDELTKSSRLTYLSRFGTIELGSIIRMAIVLICVISMLISLAKLVFVTRNNPSYRVDKDNFIIKCGLILLLGFSDYIFTWGKIYLDDIFGF